MIDLHTHTTASDGELSPSALVEAAARLGLKALAVTDHDTLAGLDEALEAGRRAGITVIPGVEISTTLRGDSMHVLGYGVPAGSPSIQRTIEFVQRSRVERNPKILNRLRARGAPITWEDIVAESGGGQIGRFHFAKALVRSGFCVDTDDAFARFLRRGAPAYVERVKLTPEQAFGAIAAAGGLSVLAHPGLLKCFDLPGLDAALPGLRGLGLRGVECYYSLHSGGQTEALLSMCRRHSLLVTGGSDYHGPGKEPERQLGLGTGARAIPDEILAALLQALGQDRHRNPQFV